MLTIFVRVQIHTSWVLPGVAKLRDYAESEERLASALDCRTEAGLKMKRAGDVKNERQG